MGIALLCCSAMIAQGADATMSLKASTMDVIKVDQGPGTFIAGTRAGGDTCADATVIPGLPYTDTGSTADPNLADDYEEVCPYDATAPDVVYSYTPAVDEYVDISLCNSLYDTKLFVYEGTCPGTLVGCNDDACGDDGFKSQLPGVEMLAGNTYYIIVDGYGTSSGTYTLDVTAGSAPPTCPGDSLFAQNPDVVDWIGGTADQNAGYKRFEDFSGVAAAVGDLTWWGINAINPGTGWTACDKTNERFEITFYADAAGQPGAILCGPHTVTPTKVDTGVTFGGYPLYEYQTMIPPCAAASGWISIDGIDDGQGCWFLWAGLNYDTGGAHMYTDPNGVLQSATPGYDLAMCFGGAGGEIRGACCDLMLGTCIEDVEIFDCMGDNMEFLEDGTCADFDPPCAPATGACCFEDGTCTIVTYTECMEQLGDMNCDGVVDYMDINAFLEALYGEAHFATLYPGCPWLNGDYTGDGVVDYFDINGFVDGLNNGTIARQWLGAGTDCSDCPCIVICPDEATDEGEPCGDDTNGGCNFDPNAPIFRDVTCDELVCGTFWADGDTRDTDWYRVVITEPTILTWTVEAEGASVGWIAGFMEQTAPGVPGCDNTTGYIAPYAIGAECDKLSVSTECTVPGTYYMFVAPYDFNGLPCTSEDIDYVAGLSCEVCEIPEGACCFADGSCQVLWESTCLGQGGVLWLGADTTCEPNNPCPQPPPNDDCVTAEEIIVGTSVTVDNTAATDDPESEATCGTGLVNQAVWYYVQGTGNTMTATTCSLGSAIADSKIQVWCNECSNLVCVDGNDDGCTDPNVANGLLSTVSWCSDPNEVYYIAVGGYSSNVGVIELTVFDDGTPCDPPVNCEPPLGRCCYGDPVQCVVNLLPECDLLGGDWTEGLDCNTPCPEPFAETCDTATVITSLPYATTIDNDTATADGIQGTCDKYYNAANPAQNDAWWVWTATEDCFAVATVPATSYDQILVVRSGCEADPNTELFCSDVGYSGDAEVVEFAALAGETYYFQIADTGSFEGGGETVFTLTCSAGSGACCYGDGTCLEQTAADCSAGGGTYLGDLTVCEADTCLGACCPGDGTCQLLGPDDCDALGGEFLGIDTACDPNNPCPQPVPGQNCYTAFPIMIGLADLPHVEAGKTTCGLVDDYEDTCLGSYDGGEDTLFELEVTEAMTVNIILDPNGTGWTGVAIGDACPPDPNHCLDFATGSSGSPMIEGLALAPGKYYIMVDTWPSPDCIPYFDLTIEEFVACDVVCDPNATLENEPDCGPNYEDVTNGGCNTDPNLSSPVFSPIACGEIVCGKTGLYDYFGSTYRDTDWYEVTTIEDMEFTWTVTAEVDIIIGLVETNTPGSGDCLDSTGYLVPSASGPDCEPVSITTSCLPAGTYWFWVGADDGDCGAEYQAMLTCTPCMADPYCAGDGNSSYEWISNVLFGSIDNDSSQEGYGDFTGLSTDVDPNASYPITVTAGYAYASDVVYVYVDWNQDTVLDASERTDLIKNDTIYTGDIVVPADAVAGPTRMRIRLEDSSYGPVNGPCGSSQYGEVEDYTVNVQ